MPEHLPFHGRGNLGGAALRRFVRIVRLREIEITTSSPTESSLATQSAYSCSEPLDGEVIPPTRRSIDRVSGSMSSSRGLRSKLADGGQNRRQHVHLGCAGNSDRLSIDLDFVGDHDSHDPFSNSAQTSAWGAARVDAAAPALVSKTTAPITLRHHARLRIRDHAVAVSTVGWVACRMAVIVGPTYLAAAVIRPIGVRRCVKYTPCGGDNAQSRQKQPWHRPSGRPELPRTRGIPCQPECLYSIGAAHRERNRRTFEWHQEVERGD